MQKWYVIWLQKVIKTNYCVISAFIWFKNVCSSFTLIALYILMIFPSRKSKKNSQRIFMSTYLSSYNEMGQNAWPSNESNVYYKPMSSYVTEIKHTCGMLSKNDSLKDIWKYKEKQICCNSQLRAWNENSF